MAKRKGKYASLTADLIKRAEPAKFIGPEGAVILGWVITEGKRRAVGE